MTLGIIGVGNVGRKIVKMAESLGMRVLQNDPPRQINEGGGTFINLKELLTQSDIVTVHVPLTPSGIYPTYKLANADFFSFMKHGSYFINSSRGKVCDEKSLIMNVRNRKLAGYVMDVWETEPNPDPFLLHSADLATSHIAGYSLDGKLNATIASVKALSTFFEIALKLPDTDLLPKPANPVIDLFNYPHDELKALTDIVFRTYPISTDSDALKIQPERFEELRGNYWPRREFGAYKIAGTHIIKDSLIHLGFREG